MHFCIRILSLQGVVCLAPRDRKRSPFVMVEEWLGDRIRKLTRRLCAPNCFAAIFTAMDRPRADFTWSLGGPRR